MSRNASPLRVRRANLADTLDAERYVALLDAYARDPLGQDKPLPADGLRKVVTDLAHHPCARIFLADLAAETVGFASCFTGYSTFRAAPLLNIHDIAVLPAFRGRGIARALLQAIAAHARAEGCCKLTLEVREDNAVARALYAAEGFSAARVAGRQIQYFFLEKRLDEGADAPAEPNGTYLNP